MCCVPSRAVVNVVDIVVMSGVVLCCSAVCSTLVGVSVICVADYVRDQ